MAINPVSSSLPFVDTSLSASSSTSTSSTAQPSPAAPAPSPAITTDQLAAMEAAAIDPNLVGNANNVNSSVMNSFTTMLGGSSSSSDPLLAALDGTSGTSSSGDPLLDALNGANTSGGSTGDPLLDALNSQDAANAANQLPGSAAAENGLLSSFFTQQASSSYLNAQAMNQHTPGSGASGTTA